MSRLINVIYIICTNQIWVVFFCNSRNRRLELRSSESLRTHHLFGAMPIVMVTEPGNRSFFWKSVLGGMFRRNWKIRFGNICCRKCPKICCVHFPAGACFVEKNVFSEIVILKLIKIPNCKKKHMLARNGWRLYNYCLCVIKQLCKQSMYMQISRSCGPITWKNHILLSIHCQYI